MTTSANQFALTLASSQLIIIDMQTKLSLVMPQANMQKVIKQTQILMQGASILDQKILVTEQYPQGLGPTLPDLQPHLNHQPITKTAFSAIKEPKFIQKLHRDTTQVVLAGMESHICVLQTALDLTAMGKQVFVVEDAIISRNPANLQNAIARMRQAGCIITNTESVLFEWLAFANHPSFKAISALIK